MSAPYTGPCTLQRQQRQEEIGQTTDMNRKGQELGAFLRPPSPARVMSERMQRQGRAQTQKPAPGRCGVGRLYPVSVPGTVSSPS